MNMSGENAKGKRFIRVVLRATSRARFLPEQEVSIAARCRLGPIRLLLSTRWEEIGMESTAPRELCIEASGLAPSLENAMSEFPPVAQVFGPIIAFVTNIEVGMVDVHIAFDETPGEVEHDFVEVFLPDERGLVGDGRLIEPAHLTAFIDALERADEKPRLLRALGHYDIALKNWFFGGESLALEHLFVAAETLTKPALRRACRVHGVTEEEHARSLDIDTSERSWRYALASRVRVRDIFHGDEASHANAREASDGIEHGFMEMSKVHALARDATGTAFRHLRRAILDFLDLPQPVRQEILEKNPADIKSTRKIVKGKFIGPAGALAAKGEKYPILRWDSSIARLWRAEPRDLKVSFAEKFTVVCADEVQFQGRAFQINGRLRPGQQPIDMGPIDVQ